MCVSKVQHITGRKTGFLRFFDFSTNVATGNRKNSEFVQPQPVVRSFAVGFSSISVFFPVQRTGPANTIYGDEFKDFLESLCINKQNSTLNHMESNLWKALHCTSTITELAVLAIYAEAVSYPYMKAVHTSDAQKKNMLDLGPFHSCVYDHMQKIIAILTFSLERTWISLNHTNNYSRW